MALFKQSEYPEIEKSIAAVEAKTSGEIVVAIVPRSHDYGWLVGITTIVGIVVGTAVAVVQPHWSDGSSPWTLASLLTWQLAGLAAGLGLGLSPAARRWLTPGKFKTAWVHRESLAYFAGAGVHLTAQRAGILIFVSELEHRVEILADEGIHQRVGKSYWNEEIRFFIDELRKNRAAAQALCTTIQRIGTKLADHFPPDPNDKNELSNRIVGQLRE